MESRNLGRFASVGLAAVELATALLLGPEIRLALSKGPAARG
jgi:hypothetical protein